MIVHTGPLSPTALALQSPLSSPPTAVTSTSALRFTTQTLVLELDPNGTVRHFTDAATGVDYAATPARPFLRASTAGHPDTPCTSLRLVSAGRIEAHCQWVSRVTVEDSSRSSATRHTEATVTISIQSVNASDTHHGYLKVTVVGAVGTEIDRLQFGMVALKMPRHGNGRCQNG